ncbi:MAG: TIGR02996 domain-containing protein [Kofleriaceae bacterium]
MSISSPPTNHDRSVPDAEVQPTMTAADQLPPLKRRPRGSSPTTLIASAEPLVAALEAFHQGDRELATTYLIAAWIRTRSPWIADLLDIVTLQATEATPRSHDAWVTCAALNRASDMPGLIAGLIGADPRASADRISTLAHRKDPRLASALIELLKDPPFVRPRDADGAIERFWNAVLEALSILGDPRTVAPIEQLADTVLTLTTHADAEARSELHSQKPLGPYLKRGLAKLSTSLRRRSASTHLSDEESAVCAKIEEYFAPEVRAIESAQRLAMVEVRARRRFMRAIAERPDDDAPRLALARWLIEHNDAQGELIHLQLRRARGTSKPTDAAREAELLRSYGATWAGDLALAGRVLAFERGFPAAVRVRLPRSSDARAQLVGYPGWATVRRLECSCEIKDHARPLLTLLAHPVMRAVTEIHGINARILCGLPSDRGYQTIGFDPTSVGSWARIVLALGRMAAVTTVHLAAGRATHRPELIDPLLESRIADRLVRLVVTTEANGERSWVSALANVEASPIPRFDIQWGEHAGSTLPERVVDDLAVGASFTRDPDGGLSVLHVSHSAGRSYPLSDVLALLWQLPAQALTRFVMVDQPGMARPNARGLAELRRCLARFPRLVEAELLEPAPAGAQPAASDLEQALDSLLGPDESTRLRGAFALAVMAEPSHVPQLRAALRRTECRSSLMAALILGQLGDRDATRDLVWLLEHTAIPFGDGVRTALEAIAMLRDPAAAAAVRGCLRTELGNNDGDHASAVRRAALDALAVTGTAADVELVETAFRVGNPYDRGRAITALGLLGSGKHLEMFETAVIADDLAPSGRALLAALLLSPERISPRRIELFARSLEHWHGAEGWLALDWSLHELAMRLVTRGLIRESQQPAWLAVCRAVTRFCERVINGHRAALAEDRPSGWCVPERKVEIALCEQVAAAWSRVHQLLAAHDVTPVEPAAHDDPDAPTTTAKDDR